LNGKRSSVRVQKRLRVNKGTKKSRFRKRLTGTQFVLRKCVSSEDICPEILVLLAFTGKASQAAPWLRIPQNNGRLLPEEQMLLVSMPGGIVNEVFHNPCAGDRATEFKSRCRQLGIKGVTLHICDVSSESCIGRKLTWIRC
jgi:hypothetical protein